MNKRQLKKQVSKGNLIEYTVYENDYMVDWEDDYPYELVLTTHNKKQAFKSFRECGSRELHVKKGKNAIAIMCNIKGIVWGYPDDVFYVPCFDMTEEEQKMFDEIVDELNAMIK